MVIDKFFVGAWTTIILFCLACWLGVFYGGTALLTSLGF